MQDAAREALSFVQGRTRSDLDSNRMLVRALVNAVQEIGEAAAKVSDLGRARIPALPWGSIVQMRHILVHVYYGIDLDALWGVVEKDLRPLIDEIEEGVRSWPLPPDE
jgi:uncharacterized protein with HEPN domain